MSGQSMTAGIQNIHDSRRPNFNNLPSSLGCLRRSHVSKFYELRSDFCELLIRCRGATKTSWKTIKSRRRSQRIFSNNQLLVSTVLCEIIWPRLYWFSGQLSQLRWFSPGVRCWLSSLSDQLRSGTSSYNHIPHHHVSMRNYYNSTVE